jgi:hypothetical protein
MIRKRADADHPDRLPNLYRRNLELFGGSVCSSLFVALYQPLAHRVAGAMQRHFYGAFRHAHDFGALA